MRKIDEYEKWIKENVNEPYGTCKVFTERMQKAFPELKIVRGHYYCPAWGEREHWWLVAPDKTIVDPTAKQFPSKGGGPYIEWEEGTEEPTGICPNCGKHCYKGNYFCCDKCGIEYTAYCNDAARE